MLKLTLLFLLSNFKKLVLLDLNCSLLILFERFPFLIYELCLLPVDLIFL